MSADTNSLRNLVLKSLEKEIEYLDECSINARPGQGSIIANLATVLAVLDGKPVVVVNSSSVEA